MSRSLLLAQMRSKASALQKDIARLSQECERDRDKLMSVLVSELERELLIELHSACVPNSAGLARRIAQNIQKAISERL